MFDMDQVTSQFQSRGLLVDSPIIGKFERCKVESDKGSKKSGWYVVYEMQLNNGKRAYFGRFGNWKDADSGDKGWNIDFNAEDLSDEERSLYRKKMEESQREQRRERIEKANEAAARAEKIWAGLPDTGKSEYLGRKKVMSFGLKFTKGSVVVPVRLMDGSLAGLQFIAPDGSKKFLTGTAKTGAFHVIGDANADLEQPLIFAEGYATAATLHRVLKLPVVVAFDCGNLKPVSKQFRGVYPNRVFIFAADDDRETDGNPGVTKANDAAQSVGGHVWVPDFSDVRKTA